ncbi:hypothetical protein GLE_0830 [Lysobacter enzymogenes]|uniref:Uncharacterized protein n=1 Tax=Lysobacter enzymogenes TaxID=69 RepID=A0A0S2DCD8_LYSEN|nr:hypothetical protein GLE_0830 [Lysobacter enzymogenes]
MDRRGLRWGGRHGKAPGGAPRSVRVGAGSPHPGSGAERRGGSAGHARPHPLAGGTGTGSGNRHRRDGAYPAVRQGRDGADEGEGGVHGPSNTVPLCSASRGPKKFHRQTVRRAGLPCPRGSARARAAAAGPVRTARADGFGGYRSRRCPPRRGVAPFARFTFWPGRTAP